MTGEELGFFSETIFSCHAIDVYFSPIQMKKNRPAHTVTILLNAQDEKEIIKTIFKHSSTIGLKIRTIDRIEMKREIHNYTTSLGQIRIKRCSWENITKHSLEYEDLKTMAKHHHMSIHEVKTKIQQELKNLF